MTDEELHAIGVRMAAEKLAGDGYAVLAAEPTLGRFPQVVAERDGRMAFVLVHTAVYPERGRLFEDEAVEVLEFARGHDAQVIFFGATAMNPEGEDDAQMAAVSVGGPVSVSLRGPTPVEAIEPRMWEENALPSDVAAEAGAARAFAALWGQDAAGFGAGSELPAELAELMTDNAVLLADGELLARGRRDVSDELASRASAVMALGLPVPAETGERMIGEAAHHVVRLGLDALGETPVEARFTMRQGRLARVDLLRLAEEY